jgi:hypothetical protein
MDDSKPATPQPLTDDQIVTKRADRRAFLGTVALGSAALAAAAFAVACSKSDSCDSDLVRADRDPTDSVRPGDPCDSDGT